MKKKKKKKNNNNKEVSSKNLKTQQTFLLWLMVSVSPVRCSKNLKQSSSNSTQETKKFFAARERERERTRVFNHHVFFTKIIIWCCSRRWCRQRAHVWVRTLRRHHRRESRSLSFKFQKWYEHFFFFFCARGDVRERWVRGRSRLEYQGNYRAALFFFF